MTSSFIGGGLGADTATCLALEGDLGAERLAGAFFSPFGLRIRLGGVSGKSASASGISSSDMSEGNES